MKGISVVQLISLTVSIGIFAILLKSEVSEAAVLGESSLNEANELSRDTRAAAALASKTFEEKTCPNVNPASNLKLKWITSVAAWFVPMASNYYYHNWVERLTNKSAPGNDISKLCLKLLFLASAKPNRPYMVVAGGLKKSVVYKCLATGPHNQNCDGVVGAPDYAKGIDAYETIVATDNTKYIMVLRCIRNTIKSWFVMSPTPDPLPANIQKIIMGFLTKMAFNVKQSQTISYAACPKGTVDPRKG